LSRLAVSEELYFKRNGKANPVRIASIPSPFQNAPNGLLCLSGIRPNEIEPLKNAYNDTFDWLDEGYAELSANECEASIESYGFDCGRWVRLIGRRKQDNREADIEKMSESAVC
jgi:hypothetical protein